MVTFFQQCRAIIVVPSFQQIIAGSVLKGSMIEVSKNRYAFACHIYEKLCINLSILPAPAQQFFVEFQLTLKSQQSTLNIDKQLSRYTRTDLFPRFAVYRSTNPFDLNPLEGNKGFFFKYLQTPPPSKYIRQVCFDINTRNCPFI